MDDGQKWAVACTRTALLDAGWPDWPSTPNGCRDHRQRHRRREALPQQAADRVPRVRPRACEPRRPSRALPQRRARRDARRDRASMVDRLPEVTEDTMPGELANCTAGRVANLFNFHGPNYTVDAACASALAAMAAAVAGWSSRRIRRRDHRRHRPQHGRGSVREVLQDRRAVGHRHAAVRRRRRRVRDGRGRGAVHRQAPGRRGPRRRQHLRGGPRRRQVERRQGQGHHRSQPRRSAARGGAGVAERRRLPGAGAPHRGPRHVDTGRRRRRARQLDRGLRRRASREARSRSAR